MMTREEAIVELNVIHERLSNPKDCEDGCYSWEDGRYVEAIDMAIEALEQTQWIPCAERMPNAVDCPMDCMVTRRSKYVGNYTDMAVAEADGTWTHEDWDAIVLGDVESGRKTGLISTHDDEIIAWMPLPKPYREDGEEEWCSHLDIDRCKSDYCSSSIRK